MLIINNRLFLILQIVNKAWLLIDAVDRHLISGQKNEKGLMEINQFRNELVSQLSLINSVYSVKQEGLLKQLRKSEDMYQIQPYSSVMGSGNVQNELLQKLYQLVELQAKEIIKQEKEIQEIDQILPNQIVNQELTKEIDRLKQSIMYEEKEIKSLKQSISVVKKQQIHLDSFRHRENEEFVLSMISHEQNNIESAKKVQETLTIKFLKMENEIVDQQEKLLNAENELQKLQEILSETSVSNQLQIEKKLMSAVHQDQLARRYRETLQKEKTLLQTMCQNKKLEQAHINKYYEMLDQLKQKRQEKDEYIGFFEFALQRANKDLKKRSELAMSINRKRFIKRFPEEYQSLLNPSQCQEDTTTEVKQKIEEAKRITSLDYHDRKVNHLQNERNKIEQDILKSQLQKNSIDASDSIYQDYLRRIKTDIQAEPSEDSNLDDYYNDKINKSSLLNYDFQDAYSSPKRSFLPQFSSANKYNKNSSDQFAMQKRFRSKSNHLNIDPKKRIIFNQHSTSVRNNPVNHSLIFSRNSHKNLPLKHSYQKENSLINLPKISSWQVEIENSSKRNIERGNSQQFQVSHSVQPEKGTIKVEREDNGQEYLLINSQSNSQDRLNLKLKIVGDQLAEDQDQQKEDNTNLTKYISPYKRNLKRKIELYQLNLQQSMKNAASLDINKHDMIINPNEQNRNRLGSKLNMSGQDQNKNNFYGSYEYVQRPYDNTPPRQNLRKTLSPLQKGESSIQKREIGAQNYSYLSSQKSQSKHRNDFNNSYSDNMGKPAYGNTQKYTKRIMNESALAYKSSKLKTISPQPTKFYRSCCYLKNSFSNLQNKRYNLSQQGSTPDLQHNNSLYEYIEQSALLNKMTPPRDRSKEKIQPQKNMSKNSHTRSHSPIYSSIPEIISGRNTYSQATIPEDIRGSKMSRRSLNENDYKLASLSPYLEQIYNYTNQTRSRQPSQTQSRRGSPYNKRTLKRKSNSPSRMKDIEKLQYNDYVSVERGKQHSRNQSQNNTDIQNLKNTSRTVRNDSQKIRDNIKKISQTYGFKNEQNYQSDMENVYKISQSQSFYNSQNKIRGNPKQNFNENKTSEVFQNRSREQSFGVTARKTPQTSEAGSRTEQPVFLQIDRNVDKDPQKSHNIPNKKIESSHKFGNQEIEKQSSQKQQATQDIQQQDNENKYNDMQQKPQSQQQQVKTQQIAQQNSINGINEQSEQIQQLQIQLDNIKSLILNQDKSNIYIQQNNQEKNSPMQSSFNSPIQQNQKTVQQQNSTSSLTKSYNNQQQPIKNNNDNMSPVSTKFDQKIQTQNKFDQTKNSFNSQSPAANSQFNTPQKQQSLQQEQSLIQSQLQNSLLNWSLQSPQSQKIQGQTVQKQQQQKQQQKPQYVQNQNTQLQQQQKQEMSEYEESEYETDPQLKQNKIYLQQKQQQQPGVKIIQIQKSIPISYSLAQNSQQHKPYLQLKQQQQQSQLQSQNIQKQKQQGQSEFEQPEYETEHQQQQNKILQQKQQQQSQVKSINIQKNKTATNPFLQNQQTQQLQSQQQQQQQQKPQSNVQSLISQPQKQQKQEQSEYEESEYETDPNLKQNQIIPQQKSQSQLDANNIQNNLPTFNPQLQSQQQQQQQLSDSQQLQQSQVQNQIVRQQVEFKRAEESYNEETEYETDSNNEKIIQQNPLNNSQKLGKYQINTQKLQQPQQNIQSQVNKPQSYQQNPIPRNQQIIIKRQDTIDVGKEIAKQQSMQKGQSKIIEGGI